MAHLRRPLIRLFLGILCLLTPALAQPASETEKPTLQIVPLADLQTLGPLYYLRSEKDAERLDLIALRRSAALRVKTPGSPIIVASRHTDPKTNTPVYLPVAQAEWPAGGTKQAVLFLEPLANGQLRALAIDDSLKAFPPRTLQAVNFSAQELAGKYSSFQGPLPPGVQPPVPFPASSGNPGSIARFRVSVAWRSPNGEAELVFNGWTEAWPHARTLLVIQKLHADGSDRIQVNAIVESLPVPVDE